MLLAGGVPDPGTCRHHIRGAAQQRRIQPDHLLRAGRIRHAVQQLRQRSATADVDAEAQGARRLVVIGAVYVAARLRTCHICSCCLVCHLPTTQQHMQTMAWPSQLRALYLNA